MQLELPDGSNLEVEPGSTVLEVAHQIGPGLGKATVGARLNGDLLDLRDEVPQEGGFEVITTDSPKALEIHRHTASHVMAQAVKRLYPEAKLAIGPAIEDGFYYDFDLEEPLSEEDFADISSAMDVIIEEDYEIERFQLELKEAKELLNENGETYKLELLQGLEKSGEEKATFYRQGEFTDLCRGPHLQNTGQLKHYKLLDVAGAYWRGDENREMLQRIYGTAFPQKDQLEDFLHKRKEAKERDHRKLGPELDLFTIHPEVGPGMIYWHPKGARIRKIMEDYWEQKHLDSGYELVSTPHLGKESLWQKSGHLDHFKENMFPPMKSGKEKYYVKPMNCPFHIQIYQSRTRSYRDLPLRWAELGTVYRHERSGVLHGLLRARGFTQDDAHIICRPQEVEGEVIGVLNLTFDILSAFGFEDYQVVLSTRPEGFVGELGKWDQATSALKQALNELDLEYRVEEGEGAFYGPKIDINLQDALDRSWQCTTVQFDFNLPDRFDMTYTGQDGREHRPYMIHRALLGALERFFGILIEHYKGAFPVWLAPVQAVVLPVSQDNEKYAQTVAGQAQKAGLRAEAWTESDDTLSGMIRKAQLQKIPYMLVVGEREEESDEVSLRLRTEEDLGPRPIEEFIEFALEKVESKETL
ncbi:MAG: threonine--tRNA ligase [Candidatus Acetothermia bacterium]